MYCALQYNTVQYNIMIFYERPKDVWRWIDITDLMISQYGI